MPAESERRLLTLPQRKIVAFALTLSAVLGSIALIVFTLVLIGRLVGFFSGVLWPLAVAGVLAIVLRPLVTVFEQKMRLQRLAAVTLLYGLFIIAASALALMLVPPVVDQLLNFLYYAPTLRDEIMRTIAESNERWAAVVREQMARPTVQRMIESVVVQLQAAMGQTFPTLKAAGGGILSMLAFVTHVGIVPVYLFFFLLSRSDPIRKLKGQLPFMPVDLRDDFVFLVREFIAIIETFFRGQLIIGLIMGVLLAIGFTIIGLDFGLILGLFLGFLNIVPYLGTIVGLGVALPLAFFQGSGTLGAAAEAGAADEGGWTLVALVLLVKIIVQCIESWILTPKIMGQRTGLHPVAIIVSVFFWGKAFGGVLGMLLAIPLTAFFVTAWRLANHKYLKGLADKKE